MVFKRDKDVAIIDLLNTNMQTYTFSTQIFQNQAIINNKNFALTTDVDGYL